MNNIIIDPFNKNPLNDEPICVINNPTNPIIILCNIVLVIVSSKGLPVFKIFKFVNIVLNICICSIFCKLYVL